MEKEVCMKNQFFADTSSICYKWILLKNVSVMHRCFTCFPPPRCDWKRLMGLFYPLLVRVQHIILSSLRKKGVKIEPHHIWIDFLHYGLSVSDVSDDESSKKHTYEVQCGFFWCVRSKDTQQELPIFKLKITTMSLYVGFTFSKALYSWRILLYVSLY